MSCRYHSDRDVYITCEKVGTGYCKECLETRAECTDSQIHCKFRSGCIIHEKGKERRKQSGIDK